jgi:hypothetical protein
VQQLKLIQEIYRDVDIRSWTMFILITERKHEKEISSCIQ